MPVFVLRYKLTLLWSSLCMSLTLGTEVSRDRKSVHGKTLCAPCDLRGLPAAPVSRGGPCSLPARFPVLMCVDKPSHWTPSQTDSFTCGRISYSGVLGLEKEQCPQASWTNRKRLGNRSILVEGQIQIWTELTLQCCPPPNATPSFSLSGLKCSFCNSYPEWLWP